MTDCRESRDQRSDRRPSDTVTPPALDPRQIEALHRLFDPVLDEPIPARMLDLLHRASD
jgi:hypothetical protein